MRRATPPTTSRRSSLGSSRTSSSTGSRSASRTSPDTSSGVYVDPPPTTVTFTRSSLHPRQRDALDERSLGEQEDHDDRDHEDDRRCHREVPLHVVEPAEVGQRDGQRPVVLALTDVGERPEEVVPAEQEAEQRRGRDRWSRERNEDTQQDLQLAGAVDARGVGVLLGNRQEELAE